MTSTRGLDPVPLTNAERQAIIGLREMHPVDADGWCATCRRSYPCTRDDALHQAATAAGEWVLPLHGWPPSVGEPLSRLLDRRAELEDQISYHRQIDGRGYCLGCRVLRQVWADAPFGLLPELERAAQAVLEAIDAALNAV